jgi:RNA polymerase sigma factor (sigma-70 family)
MQDTFNQNWVAAFNEGNAKAITKWYNTFFPGIKQEIEMLTGGSPETWDLASEVVARLLESKGSFETVKNIQNYVKKIIERKCVRFAKENRKRVDNEFELSTYLINLEGEAERKAIVRNTFEYLNYIAIEKLPRQGRQVFQLYYHEELSNKEIALRLNISVKAVEHHKHFCFEKLRIAYQNKKGGGHPFLFFIFSIPFIICYHLIQKLLS